MRLRLLVGLVAVLTSPALAQNYYDPVDPSSPERLRRSLHRLIDDHNYFPYTAAPNDTWSVLDEADINPDFPARIIDVYRNVSLARPARERHSVLTREHSWPKSYGFPLERESGTVSYPHTDLHALFLADRGHNGSRSNLPYRFCGWECDERPTEPNNGRGGGAGTYPGNSNWRTGQGPTGSWETWRARRGDVARAQFYMDVRYEGGTHRSGDWEPDLILTDDSSLIVSDSTENRRIAHAGMLSVLLRWHKDDPVDAFERRRNEAIYASSGDTSRRQGNRNPFIDHPEWVQSLYGISYEIREVVDLGQNHLPKDINNRGEIVGDIILPDTTSRGFIWRNGIATDIGSFNQSCPDTSANGINDNGDIVGSSYVLVTEPSEPPSCYLHAFLMRGGSGMTDLVANLGPSGTGRVEIDARRINNAGVIIGGAFGLPLRIQNGVITELGIPGYYTRAMGINDRGDIVGQRVHPTTGSTVAVLWERGQNPRYLTDPLSNVGSEAVGLNDQGQVVGSRDQRTEPMQWWYGQPIPLQTGSALRADALAVNNTGHVVGQRALGGGVPDEAFFWSERTELLILNNLLTRGSPWRLLSAVDINDAGQIIGVGTRNGERRGFLLRLEERISHVVNSTGDSPDEDVSDARCDTGGDVTRDTETEPECTLRAAVMQVNHGGERAHIRFDIPDVSSTPQIVILSDLPAIEAPVVIDGKSQRPSERVQVSGGTPGTSTRGLVLRGGGSEIVNLSITDFSGHGLVLERQGRNRVVGTYLGVAPDGSTAAGNSGCGIALINASQNEIGGVTAADRNVISGNRLHGVCIQSGLDNQIIGNHIGADVSGRHAIRNILDGVNILAGEGNRIGAETGSSGVGAGNVISGNGRNGVTIEYEGERNQVRGNLIGTTGDGAAPLANAEDGISIAGADNIVGGPSGPSRNVVSGNTRHGIHIRGAGALRNRLEGNYIGVSRSGGASLPNQGNGVMVADAAASNVIGGQLASSTALPGSPPGNTISGNGLDGVGVGRNEPQADPTDGNIIVGNIIGMDPRGRLLLRNARHGVHLGDRAQSTRIGGNSARERNVISGNDIGVFVGKDTLQDEVSFGNAVLGNIIGANPQGSCVRLSGSCVFGNRVGVQVSDADLVRIGGPVQVVGRAPGNQISNNELDGIQLQSRLDPNGSNSITIDGNLIGTNGAGNGPVPNGRHGVSIIGSGTEGTIALGSDQGSRNVISGNVGHGILLGAQGRPTVGVVISDNFIGTDITGQRVDVDQTPNNQNEFGNGGSGIYVENATGVTVGRPITSVRCSSGCNVISGNKESGIVIAGTTTSDIDIAGNNIGTDAIGRTGLGNRLNGILVTESAREIEISNNLVSGNGTAADVLLGIDGIAIDGSTSSRPEDIFIRRNVIGMDFAGLQAVRNSGNGIFVGRAQNVEVEDNVISGNGRFGVHVRGASDVAVTANQIGRDTRIVSNGAGILIEGGASDIRIGGRGLPNPPMDPGERNEIHGGVFTKGTDTNFVTVLGNNISVPSEWMTGVQNVDGVPSELSGERLLLPLDIQSDGVTCSAWPGIGTDPFVPPPRLLRIHNDRVEGIGVPNALIEVFEVRRAGSERGRYFASAVLSRGFAVADADGRFSVTAAFAVGSMISAAQSVSGRTSELSQLKRPVIFIPGAGGTEFRRAITGIVWVPCCSGNDIHERIDLLATNSAGEDVSGLHPYDVLTHLEETVPIIYGRALDWFAAPSQGYPNNPRNRDPLNIDLWRFAYDWRLDPAVAASQLLALVDEVTTPDRLDRAESCEVDLVAHSLGGIVASVYIRGPGNRHAQDRVHRLVTIGTPYLGTPLAAEAQTDGYIFALEQSSLYRVFFPFPDWGRIIGATRNLPVVYALMPSRAYWQATVDPAYLYDTDRNLLTTFEATADFFTGSNILLGLGGNRTLLNRMSASVHDLTDDWRNYQGPPHIFRIVGDLGPDSTVSRWNYTAWPNKPRTTVPNDSPDIRDYRSHQWGQFTHGDGTVVLSSAMLGRPDSPATTDFSGVDESEWVEEFPTPFVCNHTALAGDPEGCASLAEVMKILRSGYAVP